MGHHFSLDRERKSEYHMFVLARVQTQLVSIRARVHPFPSRTRKLSSLLPTILGWRRPGKIGNANIEDSRKVVLFLFVLMKVRDGSASRDRSVKLVSSHTILGWRRPGKIGNANIKRTIDRSSSFFFVYPPVSCADSPLSARGINSAWEHIL